MRDEVAYEERLTRNDRRADALRQEAIALSEIGRDDQAFVLFHQEGMLLTINALHDRVNRLVSILLFQSRTRELLDSKAINSRQYTIVSQLLTQGRPVPLGELRHTPWYASLYLKLNDKTRSRDLKKLRELELLVLDQEDQLWPGCVQVRNPRAL